MQVNHEGIPMPVLIDIDSYEHHLFSRARNGSGAASPRNREECLDIGLINNMSDSALMSTERQLFDLLGAAAGGLTGALIGMGIPEYEAKRYEGKVKGGNVLLSVHTEDSNERDRAKKILEAGGAEDISYTGEASVPKEQKTANPR